MDIYDMLVAQALSGSGGGGGGGGATLIAEKSLGTISTTSTSAISLTTIKLDLRDVDAGIDRFGNYDLIFAIASPASEPLTTGHESTRSVVLAYGDMTASNRNSAYTVVGNFKKSNGVLTSRFNNTKYGVYVNSVSTTTTGISLDIYVRYADSYTGVIDGDYTIRFYGLTWDDIIK